MLKLINKQLPNDARIKLDELQKEVDQAVGYAAQVAMAKLEFPKRNKIGNATFDAVKSKLTEMCYGARRCMYCEDSVADEVEHFCPKDLYPGLVFAWKNYLYACGPCNGPKNSRFAIIDGSSQLLDVTRPRDGAILPPVKGDVALIDPRRENPLSFMMLDLRDTFEFTSIATPGSVEDLRANYTIEILRLNERDYLVEARVNAFSGFRARLSEYITRRDLGASQKELKLLREGILRAPHPSVWAEMVRQRTHHPSIAQLFATAPEAVTFV